ncbi:hypothetical protein DFA_06450 [Cavenderia fasciculata]|uniref:Letm1 RBD domain-containing protein n=1 Tax=Cavenderia fasciculata TaxID=261658 RepID=F4PJ14_CACFS|nr:uncharacterized protein DFA_06450 [Cavenderia fasciculata]EGG24300.1 hypothetical protein DFA_06450 [Cavenderia fasciculata]|eukprot:XP_004362151.1 hypothetical protein DFA_06450 [Cavenderia fasciculata]
MEEIKNHDDDNNGKDKVEESFFTKMKRLSYELGQQTKAGIVSYYRNWRYIQDVIKPKRNAGITLPRKDIIHLKTFKTDSLYWIPLGLYSFIPFSAFGLPIYVKYLSSILPSTFSTRQMIVDRMLTTQKYRVKLAKILLGLFSRQQQDEIMNGIRIQDLNRTQLILLSRCIGIKCIELKSTKQLKQKLKDWEKEIIKDNQLIIGEGIDKLSIEELQDISYHRGIHFKNKSYNQLIDILSNSLSSTTPPLHSTSSSYCFSIISNLIDE